MLPMMSMLDLLFGAFGAMIAVAAGLSALQAQSPSVGSPAFLHITIDITPADGTQGEVLANGGLEPLFIAFLGVECTEAEGRAEAECGPHKAKAGQAQEMEEPKHPIYWGRSQAKQVSAALFDPTPGERKHNDGIGAVLHNAPGLLYDSGMSPNDEVTIVAAIRVNDGTCDARKTLRISDFFDKVAPSIFNLMADQNSRLMCQQNTANTNKVTTFIVSGDGRIHGT